jgi:hypothetical protein
MPTARMGEWYAEAVRRGLIPATATAPAPGASEKEFQAAVVRLAESHGWRVYHTHDSRRSEAGFPDLCMVRRGVLVFIELKSEVGLPTAAQKEWLADLELVTGVVVRLWRPSDWNEVVTLLGGTTNDQR